MNKTLSQVEATSRRRAVTEQVVHEREVQSNRDNQNLSAAEIKRVNHELSVHEIELKM